MARNKPFDPSVDYGNGDAQAADVSRLMCSASGCPNRWTADMGNGKLCSWHDVAQPHDWPQITQELRDILSRGGTPIRPPLRAAPRRPGPAIQRGLVNDAISVADKLRQRFVSDPAQDAMP